MNLAGIIATIFATLIKAIFGTDKPHETEVKIAVPEIDIAGPGDADLLRDLGL